MVRKKIDSRVRGMIESAVATNQRAMIVLVGDRGREQVSCCPTSISCARMVDMFGRRRPRAKAQSGILALPRLSLRVPGRQSALHALQSCSEGPPERPVVLQEGAGLHNVSAAHASTALAAFLTVQGIVASA
jgi:hypothetical protein